MHSPQPNHAREADRVADRICERRLMNASLAAAAAWLTYVNPFTLHVRAEGGWPWLTAVIAVSGAAVGYALWSVTTGDRRAWLQAFRAVTRDRLATVSNES